jgi:hypothetical protein
MAAAQSKINQDIKAQFLGMIEKKLGKPLNQAVHTETVPLTLKGMKKEGATEPDDYIRSLQQDLLGGILKQTISSTNFMPLKLDPNVYDQSTLFMTSPALTFLEGRNRRAPADTTKISFIELTEGFQAEWIAETDGTEGDGTAQTELGIATMCVQALPIRQRTVRSIQSTTYAVCTRSSQRRFRQYNNQRNTRNSRFSNK